MLIKLYKPIIKKKQFCPFILLTESQGLKPENTANVKCHHDNWSNQGRS